MATGLLGQQAGIVEPGRHHHARHEAAGDRVPGDALPDQLQPLAAELEESARRPGTQAAGEVVRGAGEAGRRDAAVAAGGSGADPAGLEEQRLVAAFGERKGGGKSGKAAADDAGGCMDSAGERRAG